MLNKILNKIFCLKNYNVKVMLKYMPDFKKTDIPTITFGSAFLWLIYSKKK